MSTMKSRVVPRGSLLAFICFLTLLFFSNSQVVGQTLQPKPNEVAYNWKSPADVSSLLTNQINILNQQMPGLVEGTSLHDNTVRRIAYFKAIISEIKNGSSVSNSLELALPAAATLGFMKEASYTPRITLKALQTETRIMLTN